MKKSTSKSIIAAVILSVLMISVLVGCGGQQAAEQEKEQPQEQKTETQQQSQEPVMGGWEQNTETSGSLADEYKEIFEKASTEDTQLIPVSMLASQVVAGANYTYLCKTDGSEAQWQIAVVYNDLDGNASITGTKALDLSNLTTGDEQMYSEDLSGGWEIADQEGSDLPSDSKKVFDTAVTDGLNGADVKPVALLGTQVVSGTNYLFLCVTSDKDMVADGKNTLLVLKAYEDLDGNVQLADVLPFNLLEYV